MILKFRTGTELNFGWKIIGNVEQIDWERINEPIEFKRGSEYINVFPDIKKNKKIVEMIILHTNGLSKVIYTDDMVYILNDNGKTCDTINI